MNETFFRVILENPNTNYYFLCGGTFAEIREHLRAEDSERNDGKICDIALQNLKAYLDRNTKYKFANFGFNNGLKITLINEGILSENTTPAANLLLNLLGLKENHKNDGE